MESISLERSDLLVVEPLTYTQTMKLLPVGNSKMQKLVIGDDSGTVYCYEFNKDKKKDGVPQIIFSERLFDVPISSITIGSNPTKRDKPLIYAASCGQRIKGISKKGVEEFSLESSLTEAFNNIIATDTRLWTTCESIFNVFDNKISTSFYLCKDQVNDIIVEKFSHNSQLFAILACRDNCLRFVDGSQVVFTIATPAAVSTMVVVPSLQPNANSITLVLGLEHGSICCIEVFTIGTHQILWTLEDNPRRCTVKCLDVCDINKRGSLNIIVGRDDGRLEILTNTEVSVSKDLGESIRSIACGFLRSTDYKEIVVATYSGKVITFTTEPILNRAPADTHGRTIKTVYNENHINSLKKEIDDLRKKVEKDRSKKMLTQCISTTNQDIPISSKFLLDPSKAAYTLTLEIQFPIDLVIIRSSVSLELVDSDVGNTIVSITPQHLLQPLVSSRQGAIGIGASRGSVDSSKFLATFRFQGQVKRISISFRSTEGELGDILATLVTQSSPKCAKIVKFPIKPLSLHYRLPEFSQLDEARPRSKIVITGSVHMSMWLEWIETILPNVPQRFSEDESNCRLWYKNAFTDATMLCSFKRNELQIESESASTITIFKENITRLANFRRIQIDEKMSPINDGIVFFLSLIRPKLEYQLSLTRKMQLASALQEITMQEPDITWLSEEYITIINDQELIRREHKLRAKSLDYLTILLNDLYLDWNRMHGIDGRNNLGLVNQTILSGDYTALCKIFLSLPTASN